MQQFEPMSNTGLVQRVEEGLTVDLLQVARMFWRRRALIIGVTAVLLTISVFRISQIVPMYTAEAMIRVGLEEARVVNVVSVVQTDTSNIESEVFVLQSRTLADRVVTRLNLMEDPDFNFNIRPNSEPGFGTYLNPLNWFGLLKKMLFGDSRPANAMDEGADATARRERAAVVSAVVGGVSAEQEGWSDIITLNVQTVDPRKSMKVANALVDEYLVSQLEAKFGATERATRWLNERITGMRERVETAERAVEDYRARTGLIRSAGDTTLAGQQISQINSQLVIARSETATAVARLRQVESLIATKGIKKGSENLDSTQIQNLRTQETVLTRRAAELSQEYGDRHPPNDQSPGASRKHKRTDF